MARTRLTPALCQNLAPDPANPERRQRVYDSEVPGLVLQVEPSGQKSWKAIYRHAGRLRWYSLAKFEHLTLTDARREARKVLGRVAMGEDPQAEKTARRQQARAKTFADMAEAWFAADHDTKPTTQRIYRAHYDNHLKPAIGKTPVAELTTYDFQDLADGMAARGLSGSVGPVLAVASRICQFGIARRNFDITTNPVRDVQKPAHRSQSGRELSPDEIRRIWRHLDAVPEPWNDILRVQLFTGQRIGEVAALRWEDLDRDWAWWTQTTNKEDRPHRVYLTETVRAVLRQRPGRQGFVFSPHRRTPATMPNGALHKLRAASGVRDFKSHDLRHTAKTRMAELKVPYEIRSLVQNHALAGMDAVYNHYDYSDERRAALVKLERYYLSVLGFLPEGVTVVGAQVVDIESARRTFG